MRTSNTKIAETSTYACAPPNSPNKLLRVGAWRVDVSAREISNGMEVNRLSPRAMAVLLVLVEAGGAVVSRNCLMDAVWPDVHVGDESLTQAVAELRRVFGQKGSRNECIATVQKAGYRLAVPVTEDITTRPQTSADPAGEIELPLQAHLAVSQARQLRWLHGYTATSEMKELMDEAAAVAPRSACVQAEYAVLVGCTILHRGDREMRSTAACDAARRAVALRPDIATSHCAFGFASANLGRLDDCTKAFQHAFAIEPNNAEAHSLAAQAFFGLGASETALILAERAAALDSEDILPPYVAARAALAIGQIERSKVAARMCLSRADVRLMLTPDSVRASSMRAAALAMLGRQDEALVEATRKGGEPNFRDMVALAEIGAIDAALDYLEALVDNGWHAKGWIAKDPVFDRLRNERRYDRLARQFLDS